MNLFRNFFKPKKTKSIPLNVFPSNQTYYYATGNSVFPSTAIKYYNCISAISTGIDLIAEEIENIHPVIFDKLEKKIIDQDPILDLLDFPNSDVTRSEFLGQIARYFSITGNVFIGATGNINRPPLELLNINPILIRIEKSSVDTFPEKYIFTPDTTENFVFMREEKNSRLIFISNNEQQQLWHIRGFNTSTGQSGLWARPKLNAIFLEIEQFNNANIHNLSVLEKGMRPSAFIGFETNLSQDQRDYLSQQFNDEHIGPSNAGGIFFGDGGKFSIAQLSQNMKDMDFRGLRSDMKIDIYNRLKVPLPLVTTENQKFDNMREAKLSLYDNAVLPLLNKILHELTLFLFPRFNRDIKRFTLAFDPNDIQVLRERIRISNNEMKDILTKNEQRNFENFDNQEGGDILYQAANLVPLGSNPLLQSSPITPETKQQMIDDFLLKQIYETGERVYPDMAIKKI